MHTTLLLIFIGFATIGRCEERLVTSAGKHSGENGKMNLELSSVDEKHIQFCVSWEGKRQLEDGLIATTTWEQKFDEPVPVAPQKWAFCFVGGDELWFCNGEGIIYRYKGAANGLESSANCTDKNLEEAAPKILKKWIKERRRPAL